MGSCWSGLASPLSACARMPSVSPPRRWRDQLGFPGYQYVAVPHPIASRTEKEIDEMARDALPDILRVLGAGLTLTWG